MIVFSTSGFVGSKEDTAGVSLATASSAEASFMIKSSTAVSSGMERFCASSTMRSPFSVRETAVSCSSCGLFSSHSVSICWAVSLDTSSPSTSVWGNAVLPYTVCVTTQAAR